MLGRSRFEELEHLSPKLQARVYLYAKARSRRYWQIWICRLMYICVVFALIVVPFIRDDSLMLLFPCAIAFALITIYVDGIVTKRVMRNSIREYLGRACIQCGYDLTGTRAAGLADCPECGTHNDETAILWPFCRHCGGDLRATIVARDDECPHCGRSFDLKAAWVMMNAMNQTKT